MINVSQEVGLELLQLEIIKYSAFSPHDAFVLFSRKQNSLEFVFYFRIISRDASTSS